MERGYPPPQPTRVSGERRKLPQRGPGRSPGRKRLLVHFKLEKTNLVVTNLMLLCHFNISFPFLDILSHSGDIRDQSRRLYKIDGNFACFWPPFLRGALPEFLESIYKIDTGSDHVAK